MSVQQVSQGWEALLEGDVREAVEAGALPAFLRKQRWYAGKARPLERVRIVDVGQPEDFPATTFLALAEAAYQDGSTETYFLPLGMASGTAADRMAQEAPARIIARLDGGAILYDALADPAACWALLNAIGDGRSMPLQEGLVRALPTTAFAQARGPTSQPLEVLRGTAEQSNSAVMFDHRLILKVFRRIEPGINPDFEIGKFLSERTHFDRIPKTAGTIEYHRRGHEPATLAILQALVRNQGTGWEHALHELRRYYEECARRSLPGDLLATADAAVLALSDGEVPPRVQRIIGPYLKAAGTLGRRTAELHRALASDPNDPDFAPEPIDRDDLVALRDGIRRQVEQALETLHATLDRLPESVRGSARAALDEVPGLLGPLDELPELTPGSTKIRCHGDYHLGQVLRTDEDFIILDFEGEPAKPLPLRREKQSPLKDVVGMLRSFDYAAYAALFAIAADRPHDFERLLPWAGLWRNWTSTVFLKEYRAAAAGASFLPGDTEALATLLRSFTLDKALYELLYELNNRPDWVRIPLQGIIALVRQARIPATAEPFPSAPSGMEHTPVGETRFTDFDVHLLAEGTHDHAYEKLGAHVVESHGNRGTNFAVWAPNARAVSIVGDFNGWDLRASPMWRRAHIGLWERYLPGVGPGSTYKYAILPRDSDTWIFKADPYSFAAEVRPHNSSRVCDLSTYTWGDRDWMISRRAAHAPSAPLTIYEVHLGSWMRVPEEGNRWLSYREIAPRLADYVAEMGFTHVELLPITESPTDDSWGYDATGYFAPTSRYGTPHDFMHLVDTLHQRGIGVILDWVPGHFPSDESSLASFDGEPVYERATPNRDPDAEPVPGRFDYGRPEVANFLIASALFWLDRYHIDGLRVGAVASMLFPSAADPDGDGGSDDYRSREDLGAITFLRRLNDRVHVEFPDALTFAEETTAWPMVTRPTSVGGLGFDLKWDIGWAHDTLSYLRHDPLYRKLHHNLLTFRGMYAFGENYVLPLSHDEVASGRGALVTRMPGDDWLKFANLRLLFGWMYVQSGKKLTFMGNEFGPWREWDHAMSLDWHLLHQPLHQGLRRWVRDLNTQYRGVPALHVLDGQPAGFAWADCHDAEQSVISLFRKGKTADDLVLCVLNFTPVARQNYRIGVPRAGTWEEILNSDAHLYGGSGKGNIGGVRATPVAWHGQYHSLNLTLPPLAMVALRYRGR